MRGRSRVAVVIASCALVAVGLGAWSATRSPGNPVPSRSSRVGDTQRTPQTSDAFLSLVPACGCARRTDLELFSTGDGRLLRRLGPIQLPTDADVSTPGAQTNRGLLMTVSTGPRCALRGTYAECPRIAPDSCTNEVLRAIPGTGRTDVAFAVSGRFSIDNAVPSPSGRAIVLTRSPCTAENGPTDLIQRASAARERIVFGRRNACDTIERPAWNPAGDRLVFVYDQARSAPNRGSVGGVRGCPTSRNQLVITGTAPHAPRRRIADAEGCAYAAAAFDPEGVLAVEGCKQGAPPGFDDTNLGDGYLVQFSPTGHRLRRWPLRRGVEQALITHEPGTGQLLITQDLPANNHEPGADWVWELSGSRLRLIHHYPAEDAAQVLAVGW